VPTSKPTFPFDEEDTGIDAALATEARAIWLIRDVFAQRSPAGRICLFDNSLDARASRMRKETRKPGKPDSTA
jgi:hypothetical protein